jgi:hypothetical protein
MKNEENNFPPILSDSAVLSATLGLAYLSTTAVYAVGGKEKNKVFNPRKN